MEPIIDPIVEPMTEPETLSNYTIALRKAVKNYKDKNKEHITTYASKRYFTGKDDPVRVQHLKDQRHKYYIRNRDNARLNKIKEFEKNQVNSKQVEEYVNEMKTKDSVEANKLKIENKALKEVIRSMEKQLLQLII